MVDIIQREVSSTDLKDVVAKLIPDALERIWTSTTGWRLMATTSSSDWAWDVKRLKFVTASGELTPGGAGGCVAVDSGHADTLGYGPENAFTEQGVWGGRKDSSGKLYIGLECSTSEDVVAVELEQGSGHHVSGVEIQKNEGAGWNSIATVSVSQADALETIWPAPTGWRLVATTSSSDWAWDVKRLKFVTAS